MPNQLIIPLGSPVRWTISTATGTLNDGQTLRNNEDYPRGQTKCGKYYPDWAQPFDCQDTLTIQVQHTDSGGDEISLDVMDYDTDTAVLSYQLIDSIAGYKEATIDFSGVTCGKCYYLQIQTFTIPSVGNIIGFCDSGTFESGTPGTWGATTGAGNALTKDAVTFRSGAASGAITANASPAAGDEVILYKTAGHTAPNANSWYIWQAWVYEPTVTPFAPDGEQIYFEVTSGFTDSILVSETRVTTFPTGRDTWQEIRLILFIGSDTTGTVQIKCSATPTGSGQVYIDDISLKEMDAIQEATSEKLTVEELDSDCFPLVRYYSDNDSHGFSYQMGHVNKLRLPSRVIAEEFPDPNFKRLFQSDGDNLQISSKMQQLITVQTDYFPRYFHRILAIALKHGHFEYNGLEYIPLEAGYAPNYPDDDWEKGNAEIQLLATDFDQDYTYQ